MLSVVHPGSVSAFDRHDKDKDVEWRGGVVGVCGAETIRFGEVRFFHSIVGVLGVSHFTVVIIADWLFKSWT